MRHLFTHPLGQRFGRGPIGRAFEGLARHGHGFGHGGEGGHRGGGRGGRGGSMGRFFDHGDLRFVILGLIADKPSHGYELIKAIEDRVGGAYSPSPGVIYPTLTLLDELGYVTVSTETGPRKLYAITDEGLAFLEANRDTVTAVFARMDEAGERRGGGTAPQIVRAIENLKLTVRLRLDRGPLSEAETETIAKALDDAAATIERS